MFHDLVAAVTTPARAISSVVTGPRVNARSLQSSLASTYTTKEKTFCTKESQYLQVQNLGYLDTK